MDLSREALRDKRRDFADAWWNMRRSKDFVEIVSVVSISAVMLTASVGMISFGHERALDEGRGPLIVKQMEEIDPAGRHVEIDWTEYMGGKYRRAHTDYEAIAYETPGVYEVTVENDVHHGQDQRELYVTKDVYDQLEEGKAVPKPVLADMDMDYDPDAKRHDLERSGITEDLEQVDRDAKHLADKYGAPITHDDRIGL
jgi:hypothetical protein